MGDAPGANPCHPAFGTSAREKAIVIETPRTIIRPYEGSEAPLLLPIFSDPTTMSFWSRPLDKDAIAAWAARAAQEFRQTGGGRARASGAALRAARGGGVLGGAPRQGRRRGLGGAGRAGVPPDGDGPDARGGPRGRGARRGLRDHARRGRRGGAGRPGAPNPH